jgi:hypothetical protein
MNKLERAIIATLIYYDSLDRPLTAVETFKYLANSKSQISFFEFSQTLKESARLKKVVGCRDGLYFLKNRSLLIGLREKRLKCSQLKWKTLKKTVKWLALAPFVELVAVTGSLTAYNTRQSSDFDLLVVTQKKRLWNARLAITLLSSLLSRRRHGQLTKDRLCLNCYLAAGSLKISPQAKTRDFHSAQEYGRLTPVLEIKPRLYGQFIAANAWIGKYLNFYPWPNALGARQIKASRFSAPLRRFFEWPLANRAGDWLERELGNWQKRRISQKHAAETEPADQVYVSDTCLMFHPQSKSYRLMQDFNMRLAKIKSICSQSR